MEFLPLIYTLAWDTKKNLYKEFESVSPWLDHYHQMASLSLSLPQLPYPNLDSFEHQFTPADWHPNEQQTCH